MKRDWAAQRQSLPTVRFNAANGEAWFWPKIAASLKNIIGWSFCATQRPAMSANDPKRTLVRLATARARQGRLELEGNMGDVYKRRGDRIVRAVAPTRPTIPT